MRERGTVLLVEPDEAEREHLGRALEDAGCQVITCPGPTAPDYTCIGGRKGHCPLLERADVVVLDSFLASDESGFGTTSAELLMMYSAGGRTVVTLGSCEWAEPFAEGDVIGLATRPDAEEVVAAVRGAADVDEVAFRR